MKKRRKAAKCKCLVVYKGKSPVGNTLAVICGKSSPKALRKIHKETLRRNRAAGESTAKYRGAKTMIARCNSVGRVKIPVRKA